MKKINKKPKFVIRNLSFVVITMALFALLLFACAGIDPHKGVVAFDINSEDDFNNIRNQLGVNYDQATFNLKTNLILDYTDEIWTPIGSSVESSFRSTFNGGGNTITLNVGTSLDYVAFSERAFGLFGYAYDAIFKDFTLNANFYLNQTAISAGVGALAGHAFGDCVIENVNYSLTAIIRPELEFVDGDEDDEVDNEKTLYIGGLLGVGTGSFNIEGAKNNKSEINVAVLRNPQFFDPLKGRFSNVFLGTVAGLLRPVDISVKVDDPADEESKATERNIKISNLNLLPQINCNAVNVYAGGLAGAVYGAEISEVSMISNRPITILVGNRSYFGSLLGLMDNTFLSGAVVNQDFIYRAMADGGPSVMVGGIVGYALNNSSIESTQYTGVIDIQIRRVNYSGAEVSQSFAGGIAGNLRNSNIVDSIANGGFKIDGSTDAEDFAQTNILSRFAVKNLASIAGRIYGISTLENVDSANFVAYQAVTAQIAVSVLVKNDDGKISLNFDYRRPRLINVTFDEQSGAWWYKENGGPPSEFEPYDFTQFVVE
jgi:hypothetical protein